MEAERIYTKQPSRAIQQKRGGESALEMVDNRPKIQSCIQCEALSADGFLSGDVCYTKKKNKGCTSAWKMEARGIQFTNSRCFQLPIGNYPQVNPPGWERVMNCVRMHLLNAQLGGTGSDIKNLAIGSYYLNSLHKNKVESTLLSVVRDKRGTIDKYEIECTYESGRGDLDYTLNSIQYSYECHWLKNQQRENKSDNGTLYDIW